VGPQSFVGVELQAKPGRLRQWDELVGPWRCGRGIRDAVVAFDPFIAAEQARDLEIELASLDQVFAELISLTVQRRLTANPRHYR